MKTTLLVILSVFSTLLGAAVYTNPEKHFSFEYLDSEWEVVPTRSETGKAGPELDRTMQEKTLVTLQRKTADEKYRTRFSVVLDDPSKVKGKESDPFERYKNYS